MDSAELAGVKVMVIDDSNTIRRSAEIFLRQAGCTVILAEDGFDALAKMAASHGAPPDAFNRLVYRLMVYDKVMQPLPEDQVSEKSLRHKLAMWYSRQLPKDHPLLK